MEDAIDSGAGLGGEGLSGGVSAPAIEGVITPDVGGGQAPITQDASQVIPDVVTEQVTSNWYEGADEQYHELLGKYKDPKDFIHAAYNLSKMVGKHVHEFSQEDWNTYNNIQRSMNGVPTEAGAYTFPDQLADGRLINPAFIPQEFPQALQEFCHKYELTQEQANDVMQDAFSSIMDGVEAQELNNLSIVDQCYDYIDTAWNGAEDQKTAQVSTALTEILPSLIGRERTAELAQVLQSNGLHLHPAILNLFAQLGGSINTGRSNGFSNMCQEDACQTLEHFNSNPDTQAILGNPRHPQYQQKCKELMTLIAKKNGEF